MSGRGTAPRRKRVGPLRVGALAFGTAVLLAAPAAAQETIALNFGWEPGLRGTVTQTMDQSTGMMGMQVAQRMVTRFSIVTMEHPEGLLIRFRDGEVLESTMPGFPGMPDNAMTSGAEEFATLAATASYDAIVDDDGNIVRIERDEETMAQLRAAVDEMMAPLREMAGDMAMEMPSMLENMVSDEMLDAAVRQSWDTSMGFRPGDEVVVGETYEARHELPFPIMQNRSVLMDLATTVAGRAACTEGGAADACVRIVTDSRTDPEDLRMMMEEMFDQLLVDMPVEMEMSMGAFEQTFQVESIVEPGTLLPHLVTLTSDAEMEMQMMGQSLTTLQDLEMRIEYTWEGR